MIMINTTELKLGNYVSPKDFPNAIIVGITSNSVVVSLPESDSDGWGFDDDDLEPIPLTEDIMRKTNLIEKGMLFSAPDEINKESNKDLGIKYCSFFFNKRLNRWMDCQTRVCVDSVHELQNLYVALTNTKLEISL